MKEERRPMLVRVTDESREAWQTFARANGVTVTSLIEAIGPELLDIDHRLTPRLRRAVEKARKLDAERRAR